jgi:hypothetical protein
MAADLAGPRMPMAASRPSRWRSTSACAGWRREQRFHAGSVAVLQQQDALLEQLPRNRCWNLGGHGDAKGSEL